MKSSHLVNYGLYLMVLMSLPLLACQRVQPPEMPQETRLKAGNPGEKLTAATAAVPIPAAHQDKAAPTEAEPPTAEPRRPLREQPAPAEAAPVGKPVLIVATPEVPADIVIHNAVGKASEDHKDVLVYVGATWCEPCVRFKKALKDGDFDASLVGVRFLHFDADDDKERLNAAGYNWTYVPLFVRPGVNGRSSDVQMAGVASKADGGSDLIERLQKLLGRKPTP